MGEDTDIWLATPPDAEPIAMPIMNPAVFIPDAAPVLSAQTQALVLQVVRLSGL